MNKLESVKNIQMRKYNLFFKFNWYGSYQYTFYILY